MLEYLSSFLQKRQLMKESLSLFGRNPSYEQASLIVQAVPWAVTASLCGGAERGPELISKASSFIDFFSIEEEDVRDKGIYFQKAPDWVKKLHRQTRKTAEPVIQLEEKAPGDFPPALIQKIDSAGLKIRDWVFQSAKNISEAGKLFGLAGGDHSVSEGAVQYFAVAYKGDFGLLHIDAHADLRKSYQGFMHSHASVMYNVMHNQSLAPAVLTQVGVRDYSKQEFLLIKSRKDIHTFFDSQIKQRLFEGETWSAVVENILQTLPQRVYISLDVDGLKPHLFPHTGTPVPGGLSFEQTMYLLSKIKQSGITLIGFDLVETAGPDETKASVVCDGQNAARLLYKLCQIMLN